MNYAQCMQVLVPTRYFAMLLSYVHIIHDGYDVTTECMSETVKLVSNTIQKMKEKNMNLPGAIVNLPTLTENDEVDLVEFGLKQNVDFVAASFVRKGSDVEYIREVLGEKGALKINTLDSDLTFFENGQNSSDQPLISHFRGVTQGQELKFAFDKPEPLKVEHINFHNYLNGEKNSIVSIEEGYTVVQIAEAVLKSASESKVVEI